MGATFRLPIAQADEAEFRSWVEKIHPEVWAATMDGTPVTRMEHPQRLVLVVGNEGAGVRPGVAALATAELRLPESDTRF